MVKINLLAEGRRPIISRKAKGPALQLTGPNAANTFFVIGALVGLLAAGVWYWQLEGQLKAKDQEIAVAQKEVDELRQVIQEVQGYERKLKELRRKVEVITRLKDNQRGPVQVMDEVSKALPELLWLNAMDVRGNQLVFRGTALNMSAVANFIDNLDAVPSFREPVLQDASRARGRNSRGAYNFRLSVGYTIQKPKPPEATADAAPEVPGRGAIATAQAAKAAANQRGVN